MDQIEKPGMKFSIDCYSYEIVNFWFYLLSMALSMIEIFFSFMVNIRKSWKQSFNIFLYLADICCIPFGVLQSAYFPIPL